MQLPRWVLVTMFAALPLRSLCTAARHADPDLATILSRLYEETMPAQCASVCEVAAGLATSMQADGSWKDINYNDRSRTEWDPANHWGRLTTLAQAFHCVACSGGGGSTTGKPVGRLLPAIEAGIRFWKQHDFIDPNWWWNDFGVPMKMQAMLVVMANSSSADRNKVLPQDLFDYALTLLARGTDHGSYTGENLVWSLQLDIQRGSLAGNKTLVGHAFSRMWSSIVIAPQAGDGLMADGSFHQHGALLQSGSYGAGLMTDVMNFVKLSAGTAFAIPTAPLHVLVHYLTAGQQYMIRAGDTVPNASWLIPPRGREITRPGNGTFASATVVVGIDAILERLSSQGSTDARIAQLQSFQRVLQRQLPPVSSTRIFPDSDYAVHHRPGFSQDVRTWSTRTENAECVNEENELGAHLADGAAYTYVDGTEYTNIFPVWDWRKVPGVLARQSHAVRPACHYESKGATEFVGGVESNLAGVGGVVAMDFAHGPRASLAGMLPPENLFSEKPVLSTPAEYASARGALAIPSSESPDPNCARGLRSGRFCCAKSCSECGGTQCSTPPNIGMDCCVTAIGKNGRNCSDVGAPCNLHSAAPVPPPPLDPSQTLTARRAWFLIDEGMVSLTTGVALQSPDASVAVSLEQSLLQGPVCTAQRTTNGSLATTPVPRGNSSFAVSMQRMVTHRNITYVALTGASTTTLRVYVGEQQGSWHSISGEKSNQSVSADVFKLWLDFGPAPLTNGAAAHAILPGLQPADAVAVVEQLTVEANDVDRQVVLYRGKQQFDRNNIIGSSSASTVMAVVYKAGAVFTKSGAMGYDLAVNNSLILSMTRNGTQGLTFAFSRPTGGAQTVQLTARVGSLGGFTGGLKTNRESSAVSCTISNGQQIVDLALPAELGRTGVGACQAV